MLKAYKYRIYPNPKQIQHLNQSLGCIRFVYNKALEERINSYQSTGKSLNYYDQVKNLLPFLKKEYGWLESTYSQSYQAVLKNLDTAFQRFFKKSSGYPKFKAKYDNHHSLQYPQNVEVNWETNKIKLPKCGEVKAVLHRKFIGKIKTCTVSRTPTNKYFISILVENDQSLPGKSSIKEEFTIGLDLGIKHFAILSNGEKIENPHFLQKTIKKLQVEQRKLSRKVKGSKNRNKQRIKVAKVHERITNQRRDYLQKISSSIINNSEIQTVVLEDLSIKNMSKNHKLARSILDCGWGMFTDMLQYKAEWSGKNIIYIDRFDPSSKTCSCCGWKNIDLKLSDREWTCQQCQTVHDRDFNAAINIKKFGLLRIESGTERSAEPAEIPRKENRKIFPQNRIADAGSQRF